MTDNTYYDQGWNSRVREEPFLHRATRDWRDGWRDADEAIAGGEMIKEMMSDLCCARRNALEGKP